MLAATQIIMTAAALSFAPIDPVEDAASALPVTAMGVRADACSGRFIDETVDMATLRSTALGWPDKDIAVRVEADAAVIPECVAAVAAILADAGFARIYLPDGSLLPRQAAPAR